MTPATISGKTPKGAPIESYCDFVLDDTIGCPAQQRRENQYKGPPIDCDQLKNIIAKQEAKDALANEPQQSADNIIQPTPFSSPLYDPIEMRYTDFIQDRIKWDSKVWFEKCNDFENVLYTNSAEFGKGKPGQEKIINLDRRLYISDRPIYNAYIGIPANPSPSSSSGSTSSFDTFSNLYNTHY